MRALILNGLGLSLFQRGVCVGTSCHWSYYWMSKGRAQAFEENESLEMGKVFSLDELGTLVTPRIVVILTLGNSIITRCSDDPRARFVSSKGPKPINEHADLTSEID